MMGIAAGSFRLSDDLYPIHFQFDFFFILLPCRFFAFLVFLRGVTVHGPRKHRHSERSEESRLGRDSTRDSSLRSE